MAIELVYETHAITTDNEAGIATGWLPGTLSAAGRETAAELGDRRRDDGLAAVHVSDLARAVETARIAFEGSALPIIRDPRLRECNYGRLNGMPRDAPRSRAGGATSTSPGPAARATGDVVARTASFLEDLVRAWTGRASW